MLPDALGIDGLLGRPVDALSGGQRQRVVPVLAALVAALAVGVARRRPLAAVTG